MVQQHSTEAWQVHNGNVETPGFIVDFKQNGDSGKEHTNSLADTVEQ